MTTITYRAATAADLPALSALRWRMETEMRGVTGTSDDFAEAYKNATLAEIERGAHQPWLAEIDGVAVACAILVVWIVPPHIGETMRKRGFVSSVYTLPEYRRRGISTHLMTRLMDSAREQGIHRLILWASEMGAPVYESLGFAPSRALEINL
jgi:ribosomal protein S18 acetylase RimI-like enzyme